MRRSASASGFSSGGSASHHIAGVTTLPAFLAQAGTLTKAERARVVEQARAMIEQLYVHLPLKRAMHATDPVQRLKLLAFRLGAMSERQFHDEMIDIFTDLRDLHTNYILPNPYRTRTAFLPFLLEEFWAGGERRYLVAKTFAGLADPSFVAGVTVTSWNGIPIERAVELNAERQAGSNPDARHARGLESLTIRSMAMSSPPDELWVVVGYDDGGAESEIRLDWQVFEPDPGPDATALLGGRGPSARALGLDLRTEIARRAKKVLFNPTAMDTERVVRNARTARRRRALGLVDGAAAVPAADTSTTSTMPDVFSFGAVGTPSGTFGYIRIWTFMVDDEDAFVAEFARMAALLPQSGLILDVRGNGGGNILCAEKLLQVLTPNPVEPTYLSFLCTPLTLEICTRNPFAGAWRDSIAQSVETGEPYSQSLPLLATDDYNRLGQRYQGPVLLITDPLCYSATDIFSAGFQDNRVGKILSAGGRTGAGGANVWDHALLRQVLPGPGSPFSALPKGISFRVSIRRVTRSGVRRGVPLEDLGVTPDAEHRMTRDDLLNGNVDLIAKAGAMLAAEPGVALAVSLSAGSAGKRTVTVTTAGLNRVDVHVDGRPRATTDVTDGSTIIEIANPGAGHDVAVRGFKAGTLRAVAHART
jgi:Peptidase family S41